MEDWSPQDAMKAYLQTLHLVGKMQFYEKDEGDKPRVIEPKCMELTSALAAGKGAKLTVEITTEGITPLTIALGVAAKQTGGQLICILASKSDKYYSSLKTKAQYRLVDMADLGDVVKLVHARSPCEIIKRLKNIDFAVIDCRFDDNYLKLMFKKLDANIIPTGSAVIVRNLHRRKAGSSVSFAQIVKRRRGAESVTLPIGEGIELIKILSCKRFHVTFDN